MVIIVMITVLALLPFIDFCRHNVPIFLEVSEVRLFLLICILCTIIYICHVTLQNCLNNTYRNSTDADWSTGVDVLPQVPHKTAGCVCFPPKARIAMFARHTSRDDTQGAISCV